MSQIDTTKLRKHFRSEYQKKSQEIIQRLEKETTTSPEISMVAFLNAGSEMHLERGRILETYIEYLGLTLNSTLLNIINRAVNVDSFDIVEDFTRQGLNLVKACQEKEL